VALCDIDRFKTINDTWGHPCGDLVLAMIAGALKATVRRQDSLARWGGEEFLVLLPDTDLAAARAVAERLRSAVALHHLALGAQALSVTMTVGVSELRLGERFDDCVARADAALIRGKIGGRDRVEMGA
jgi:diguanylate cyclase (GGDEF)-like protein